MRYARFILILVLAVALGLGLGLWLGGQGKKDPPAVTGAQSTFFARVLVFLHLNKQAPAASEPSVPVEVTLAANGTMSATLLLSGEITPLRQAEVKSKVAGTVDSVSVMEGDRVRKGDLLITLDSRDQGAQVSQAQAAVQAAQARVSQTEAGLGLQSTTTQTQIQQSAMQLGQAQEGLLQAQASFANASRELDRMKVLYDRGAASRQQMEGLQLQYDLAKSRVEIARQQVEMARQGVKLSRAGTAQNTIRAEEQKGARAALAQARANLEAAQLQYDHCFIRSPIDGTVTTRATDPGEAVSAGGSDSLMVITDNSVVYFEGPVGEEEAGDLRIGSSARVTVDALPGKLFSGKVAALVPAADPRSHTFKVRINVPDPTAQLRAGTFARAELTIHEYTGILVARQQIVRGDKGPYVVKINQGKALQVPVKILYANEEQAVLKDSLHPGDQIVSRGQELLKDGQPVHLTTEKEKS